MIVSFSARAESMLGLLGLSQARSRTAAEHARAHSSAYTHQFVCTLQVRQDDGLNLSTAPKTLPTRANSIIAELSSVGSDRGFHHLWWAAAAHHDRMESCAPVANRRRPVVCSR